MSLGKVQRGAGNRPPRLDIVLVDAQSVAPQTWRNGGGQTRELLAWPSGADWCLRISRADIATDGPFSAFADVQRWFAVLQGAGVVLQFSDGERVVRRGDAPLCFAGAAAPGCRLLDGPTQDLNLMVRQGRGTMCQALAGLPWAGAFAMRGLYTTVAGQWCGDGQTLPVPAHTLLWSQVAGAGDWVLTPDDPTATHCAWWLGFTQEDMPCNT